MAIQELQGDLIFLRQLQFKPAESSYGLFVAKLAGLPNAVIQRAQSLLKDYLKRNKNSQVESLSLFEAPTVIEVQDFAKQELLSLDLDNLSPREVWAWVEKKQKEYKN
jgi:DNA mismatch repair protein MutS